MKWVAVFVSYTNTEGPYETTAGKGTTKLMNSFGKQDNNTPHVASFSLYFCLPRIQMASFFLFSKECKR